MNSLIIIDQDHAFTTSLLVAERFDKQHKNVLQSIEAVIKKCPDKAFAQLNFQPSKYQVKAGKNSIREEKTYNLTRDGFTLLVRGFTGDKAFLWNIAFINAFNQMEQLLNQALTTEHHALIDGLYKKHPQWQETADYTRQGLSTGQIAKLQGKAKSSVRAMKARIRAAGIDLKAFTQTIHLTGETA